MTHSMLMSLLGLVLSSGGAITIGYGFGSVYSGWPFRIFWIVVGFLVALSGLFVLSRIS